MCRRGLFASAAKSEVSIPIGSRFLAGNISLSIFASPRISFIRRASIPLGSTVDLKLKPRVSLRVSRESTVLRPFRTSFENFHAQSLLSLVLLSLKHECVNSDVAIVEVQRICGRDVLRKEGTNQKVIKRRVRSFKLL